MSWIYHQSTGVLEHNGHYAGKGYSGAQGLVNDHRMERYSNAGPIPIGPYHIGRVETDHLTREGHHLETAMRLSPVGHNAYGRTGFFIHGSRNPRVQDRSKGCIVLEPQYREKIAHSGDWDLEVVP